jgi:hypothetical protein
LVANTHPCNIAINQIGQQQQAATMNTFDRKKNPLRVLTEDEFVANGWDKRTPAPVTSKTGGPLPISQM